MWRLRLADDPPIFIVEGNAPVEAYLHPERYKHYNKLSSQLAQTAGWAAR